VPDAYLDHAATTPLRPEARAAMLPWLTDRFGNPSGSHAVARRARLAVDDARDTVAATLGVDPGEVVFTAGATEADNTAVAGAGPTGGRVVTSAAEHHAVLEPVQRLGDRGVVVGVTATGHVDLDALSGVLASADGDVRLVSVMAVNNEVGTVTDLAAVAAVVRAEAPDAVLHTDAVQAPTWLDLRPICATADLISLSAHKVGGPQGNGVLVVRAGTPLRALLTGGGQERELRSGTHAVAGIVATAAAFAAADAGRAAEVARVSALRYRLVAGLTAFDRVSGTVPTAATVPGIVHVCVEGAESEALLYLLDEGGVCAAAGSACAAGALEPSHVLAAMGVPEARAAGALRFSLGHTTSAADVDRAVDVVADTVARLGGTRVPHGVPA